MQMPAPKSSFPPVADARTRLLVLGSLPGEISLARAQYYANPRNQFWTLMTAVTGIKLAEMAYEARLAALLDAGVGLWDVIQSAVRAGSLDANIRDHQPNALAEFCASLPALRAVAFNGGKSAGIGRRQLARADLALVALPSSSPAHTLPLARKQAEWIGLRAHLN